jgi:predicted TIM-barrel enzyme
MPRFLQQVKDEGFSGVQNFPTVGLIDGQFRANLEETDMGYDKEVEMIRLAREMDLFTSPYVFTVEEAEQMTKAGADCIVAHMGLTTSGTIGAHTAKTLDQCIPEIQSIVDASRRIRTDVIVLCHGGPIASPDDAQYILQRVRNLHGFYGASSMERLPVESAMTEQVKRFKAIKLP